MEQKVNPKKDTQKMFVALNGTQRGQFIEALIKAFPTKARFAYMMSVWLDKNLEAIALGDDLTEIVFRVINSAEAEGWTDRLLIAAREANSGNPHLLAFSQQFGFAATAETSLANRQELERTIKSALGFLDVNQWREKLGQIEAQVCKIEIAANPRAITGTGFLLGPNVVMTNYHVIEAVIAGEKGETTSQKFSAKRDDVVLRFDYKRSSDGMKVNEGVEYKLDSSDWLIDFSPYHPKGREPELQELDYALLRLAGTPGNDLVGISPAKAAAPGETKRGWLSIPNTTYDFKPNTPLFILQHPEGKPLKLAFDTEAVVSENANGTRVTYKTNTEGGSSGSPCFNINWELVALHHFGATTYNQGIPLKSILKLLEQRGHKVKLGEQASPRMALEQNLQTLTLKANISDPKEPKKDNLAISDPEIDVIVTLPQKTDIQKPHLTNKLLPIIGREVDIEKLREAFTTKNYRLVTLTGVGGIGKTRLAHGLAAEITDHFKDGVFFVRLEDITLNDANDISLLAAIAQALELSEPYKVKLKEYLTDKHLLLVLDNFEQFVESSNVLNDLVEQNSKLHILVTSREDLKLKKAKYFKYLVEPMNLPDLDTIPTNHEDLSTFSSIQLFVQAAGSDFELTKANSLTVAKVCVQVEGIPLAIELVSAWVTTRSLSEILEGLEKPLDYLKLGSVDLPERQRTMLNTISWSYELLTKEQQILFTRLAVFSGSFGIEAVEHVCNFDTKFSDLDTITVIHYLITKNLVKRVVDSEDKSRYSMFLIIKEYARKKLEESSSLNEVNQKYANYYARLADDAEDKLETPEEGSILRILEAERPNLVAVLEWAVEHKDISSALKIGSLWSFWIKRGYFTRIHFLLKQVLSFPETNDQVHKSDKARALKALGNIASEQADFTSMQNYYEESLAIYNELGDQKNYPKLNYNLGVFYYKQEDYAKATYHLNESKQWFKSTPPRLAMVLNMEALGFKYIKNFSAAEVSITQAIDICRRLKDEARLALVLSTAGEISLDSGNLILAKKVLTESLQIENKQEPKNERNIIYLLQFFLGLAALQAGKNTNLKARKVLYERVAILAAAEEKFRNLNGYKPSDFELGIVQQRLELAKNFLKEKAWDIKYAEGEKFSLQDAIDFVLNV